jgi:inosine-uridine nucleoside N-ribohydrolase
MRIFGLLLMLSGAAIAQQPPGVIFDTDMGNDVDDALAMAMLHALDSRGEIRLLAVTVTKDNIQAAQFCDILNRFYGRPEIPIGLVSKGVTPENNPMISVPVERRNAAGAYVYPRKIHARRDVRDATAVLREVLEKQPDGSVTIVQVGFSTNLARLLEQPGGRELAAKKVRLLSAMAGAFPGKPEYNIKMDIPAAKKVFADWPTPIVASGFEIGLALEYPAASIERDFGYVEWHPVADSYRAYKKMPYDRPTWDLTSVLYAARPDGGYFRLSEPGTVRVLDSGVTEFAKSPGGRHRHLILDPAQKKRILDAFIELASRKPRLQ